MPLVLVLLLLAPFAAPAQVFPADVGDMIPLLSRPPLPRGGLVAGWDLRTPNLLRFSEDFSNAAWAKTLAATSTTEPGPFGANTAGKWVLSTYNGNIVFQTSVGPVAASAASVYMRTESGTLTIRVNPSTGEAAPGDRDRTVTTTWQRFSMAIASPTVTPGILLSSPSAQTGTLYIAQPMLNSGATPAPYVATGDLQTVASTPPGTAVLTRGTTTGADTNDGTVSALGLVMAVDDRLLALPTKGAAWTTINCTPTQCDAVDSASGSWVNGVATGGATEFDLLTAGGFTGTLSMYFRYNRVLNAGEHRRIYERYIKPRVNAVGGTLP
jgi:hypothetical protein